MNRIALLFAIVTSALLSGCNGCTLGLCRGEPVPLTIERIAAAGYGAQGSSGQMNATQQRLMAMRAARIDAYRNLSEQLYGVRITGNSTVASFATQNDQVRAYVDTFLRGARLINMTQLADGSFEAILEVELPGNFRQCVSSYTPGPQCTSATPAPQVQSANTYCNGMAGCTLSSAYYSSATN
jgi:hypothetical protein